MAPLFTRLALVTAAAMIALALPGAAQAGFSEDPVPTSEVFSNGGGSSAAVDASGDAIVVWATAPTTMVKRTIKARRIKADGSLGQVLTLSDGTLIASSPEIAFARNGKAVVVWAEAASIGVNSSLTARVIEPDDSLGDIRPVRAGSSSSNSGEISVSDTSVPDTVLIAWHNFSSTPGPFRKVEARHMKSDGTLNAILIPDSTAGATSVRGAPDTAGGTLLSWAQGPAISAQNITAGDTKGPLKTPEPDKNSGPALAGDGHDKFNVVYSQQNGANWSLDFRPVAADGTGASERNLDAPGTVFVSGGLIAMNPGGRSLVAWTRNNVAKARFIDSTQNPEPETFTAPDTAGSQQGANAVGIGGSGAGAIAFQLTAPTGESSAWGRVIPATGPAPAPVRLSPPDQQASGGKLAIAPNDVGIVTWTANDGAGSFQLFARQILPPPTCTDSSATIDDGRATAVPLPCTGGQPRAADIAGQPAHGTLAAPDGPSQSVVYTPEPGYEGPDSFTWRGRNAGGPEDATRTATLTVHKAPPGAGGGPGSGGSGGPGTGDLRAPLVNRFTISPRKVRLTGHRRTKRTTLRIGLTEAATVSVTIERRRRCPRRRPRCNRFPRFGTLASKPPAGLTAAITFTNKIGRRKLVPGSYRASAVATDLAGNRSRVKRTSFKVVRR